MLFSSAYIELTKDPQIVHVYYVLTQKMKGDVMMWYFEKTGNS